MDNAKRNIHNSGPLGMLMKSGQIKKVSDNEIDANPITPNKTGSSYFKTQAGIEFSEHELLFIDPKECEPWKYANRQDDELGEMDDLIESIRINKQLQPALVRKHATPHDGLKYEVIFGRRRHIACLTLGIPFLAICKDISNVQDAIALQDAENKFRNDVSSYSNAMLYKKLLKDKVFKTEKEIAAKLRMSSSSFNDLMVYSRIPKDIAARLPNIHALSQNMALKIVSVLNKSDENHEKVLAIASEIGKTITSSLKLDRALESSKKESKELESCSPKIYMSATGQKLFTSKLDHKGNSSIVFKSDIANMIGMDDLCEAIKDYLEATLDNANPEFRIKQQSGAPD